MVKRLFIVAMAMFMLVPAEGYSQRVKKVKAPDDPQWNIFVNKEGQLQQAPTFRLKDPRETFTRWVHKNIQLPRAYPRPFLGTTVVQFYVEPDGDIIQVDILKGCGNFELDKAVVETVAKSPKWEAGTIDGVPTVLKYTFPVRFQFSAPKPATSQQRRF